ncbi:ATP-binding protein [Heliophilum fasciatum]|uniref:Uncharacterized protein YPO0396 n=1 Tax=Heliophilum fasciatum TaxID=35700 RepID=A0A4R2SBG7_9FIRM|nr:ATP-binding protein [Heliophilum fasciatum]MCW2276949.1 uncharacterized protein YPO0396 [Heliophilum fasciatum]TCP68525.1 uncharacterized protein YPO0396 [Heliophilum fasciatum]
MNLFDFVDEKQGLLFDTAPQGFRLQKLEVYNWGTFDKEVWTLSPNGETALLTGDVGSGKSTLVDALTTLLVAPKKVTYNKAADSSAKERTVNSYVRGYFGQKRSEEGTGKADALRDVNNYSVLLATFQDRGLHRYVTLAQVFWFQDAQKAPARFYVVAEKEMQIAEDFAKFGRDIKDLKKRLRKTELVQVFEDYSAYAAVFRRNFGIEQEQALDLFQQTISMKKVEALTGFVRTNMLEPPGTEEEVQKLISHFHDLDRAHDAVCKARTQIELVKPIVELGKEYRELQEQIEFLDRVKMAVVPWLAEKIVRLLSEEIVAIEKKLAVATAQREQADARLQETVDNITTTKVQIQLNGGNAIEQIKEQINQEKKILEKRYETLKRYSVQAEQLRLAVPSNIKLFIENSRELLNIKLQEQKTQKILYDELIDYGGKLKKSREELDQVLSELASLRSRKSSIPRKHIEIRKQLCQSINVSEDELPFAGELIEVKTGEENWEGAIERLLNSFGLSLLVPDKYYMDVAKWVEQTSLGIRLVYYRMQQESVRIHAEKPRPSSVIEKLMIKPDSSYISWLVSELRQRFSHVCCEDMNEFRRETQAITKAGQIKTNGKRHEKNDRHELNDRRRFILGFSNQKKIAVWEELAVNLRDAIKQIQKDIDETEEKQRASQVRLNAVNELEQHRDFSDIDVESQMKQIDEKEQKKKELEEENNLLHALQKHLKLLEVQSINQKQASEEAQGKVISLKQDKERCLDMLTSANETAEKASVAMRHKEFPYLDKHKQIALGEKPITVKHVNLFERSYRDWLEEKRKSLSQRSTSITFKITRSMMDYCNKYPDEAKDLDATINSLPEFERILGRLEKDGLPKFEKRFKELLRENTINQIALFQGKLKREQQTIQKRIEQINASLNSIDYNDGRYIRIEYEETYDVDIKEFRAQLKACTEGALTGSEDEQYAEAKFLQVKAIIERFKGRPGETEVDARWTNKVIDVRNWFTFAASERWRETDEEYEHYADSGGKSGGQKEKLAYTILAASLVYNFGLGLQKGGRRSFRFVVIDEAFLKSSDESARFGLELFKRLDLQLLIVTPLLKIPTISKFISHVGFVHHDDQQHRSKLRNISIEEYEQGRQAQGR